MTWWEKAPKHLPHKLEDLILVLRTHRKPHVIVHICNPHASAVKWEVETGQPLEVGGPASIAYTMANQQGDPVGNQVEGEDLHPRLSPLVHYGTCVPSLTHACIYIIHIHRYS